MAKINDNYLKLKAGYLFPEIGRRVRAQCNNPNAKARHFPSADICRRLDRTSIAYNNHPPILVRT